MTDGRIAEDAAYILTLSAADFIHYSNRFAEALQIFSHENERIQNQTNNFIKVIRDAARLVPGFVDPIINDVVDPDNQPVILK